MLAQDENSIHKLSGIFPILDEFQEEEQEKQLADQRRERSGGKGNVG